MKNGRSVIYRSLALLMLCGNIIITFTVIYLILDLFDLGRIVEHHTDTSDSPIWFDNLTRVLYFSAITLFSVGYGDITPYFWSRAVAILEATVGYILPAVITVQYLNMLPYPLDNLLKNKKDDKK